MAVDGQMAGVDGTGDRVAELEQQVAELGRKLAELSEALATRQLLGWVTGLLAERLRLTDEQAWGLLVRMSQNTNVKVRDVARVIFDSYGGRLAADDQPLAEQLNAQLGDGLKLIAAPGPALRADVG